MKKDYTTWKMMAGYLLVLLLMIMSQTANGQSPCGGDGLCVVQFNASFNDANKVPWINKLNECDKHFIDIAADAKAAGKYGIVVVPTILIFNGDEEVGRFQANIMMQMEAKQEDVQDKIDEIIMELF
jgi:hypothetical protein